MIFLEWASGDWHDAMVHKIFIIPSFLLFFCLASCPPFPIFLLFQYIFLVFSSFVFRCVLCIGFVFSFVFMYFLCIGFVFFCWKPVQKVKPMILRMIQVIQLFQMIQ